VTETVNGKTCLERAFELADDPKVTGFNDMRKRLIREGHNLSQLAGPILRRQLLALMRERRDKSRAAAIVGTPS
jgi:hypothetical protein